jgi:nonsense-mediated mRNA decay protein 3
MKRFCPKCGKTIIDSEMINNFCIDCYMSENELIKIPEIDIIFCVKCYKMKMGNKWYNNFEDIEEDISKNIKSKELKQPKIITKLNVNLENNIHFAEIKVNTIIGNKFKELIYKVNVNVKKDTCVTCSRIAGSYYTTILQIRFNDKKLQKLIFEKILLEIREIMSKINERTSRPSANINIIKEVAHKNGIDFYTDNLKYTKNIATHLMKHKSAIEKKYSKSLVGIDKDGKDLIRTTICVHFGNKE